MYNSNALNVQAKAATVLKGQYIICEKLSQEGTVKKT
jgi:hypothetical protein